MLILYFRLHPTPVGSAIRILSIHISLSLNIILFTFYAFISSLIIFTSSNNLYFWINEYNLKKKKKNLEFWYIISSETHFKSKKEYKIVPERGFLRFKSHPTFFRVVLYCGKVTISVFRIINTFCRFTSNN